ncbi:hypothetical protein C8J56DRAFT_879656 [Mycena floridula]|nr:hypothetical protein C8J56DRAFT_879656 [Mycena floridula]
MACRIFSGFLLHEKNQDYLNVTWHLSYAGRTPEKMTMGEFYNGLINQRYKNMSLSEHELDQGHGLFGLRSDKVEHPRRQFFAILILETAPILMWILIAAYWRGLNSTRYISISGTLLFAMAEPLSYMTWELEGIRDALEMALSILLFFPYIIMLKVVTRVEILQLLWIPNVFFGIFLTCALLKPHERLIFSPTLQPLHKTVSFFRAVVLGNGAVAAQLSGTLFQLLMNQRCRVFAGQYKATVWITGLVILNDWIFVSPRIFGQADPKAKISALDVIYLILWLCQAWQAVNLPRAKVEEDENVD